MKGQAGPMPQQTRKESRRQACSSASSMPVGSRCHAYYHARKTPLPSSHAITPLCSVPYSCSVREASCSARVAQSRHSEPCTAGDGIEEPLSPHRNFAPRALPLAYSQLGDCARHPTTLSHFQLVWWSLETVPRVRPRRMRRQLPRPVARPQPPGTPFLSAV